MKIALINMEEDYGCLPIGIAYLASYARKYGGFSDIRIIDRENRLEAIKKYKPDLIGISSVSEQYFRANKLAGEIKKITKVPLIIGGVHISAVPEQLLNSNFDFGVIGEGEITFLELLQLYQGERKFSPLALRNIKGVVFRNDKGNLEVTPRRELLSNLDSVPFPALDLLKMKEQYLVPGSAGAHLICVRGYLMTSRGCPYNCVYCGSNTTWGGRGVRWHSAERVVEVIERWVYYGANHFVVYDDLMVVNRERLKKIIDMLEKKRLLEKIDFELYGRANITDEELCKLLKRMRVTSIAFGLESGSDRMLRYLKVNSVNVQQGKNAVALCQKYGIKVAGLFIIGSPGETEEDLQQTLSFVRNPNLNTVQVYQATPLPGTELWRRAIRDNIITKDFYEHDNRGKVLELNPEAILTKEMPKNKFVEWHLLFKREMNHKNYESDKLQFNKESLRFFLSPRFYLKLWKRKRYLPRYIRQVMRIK